MRIEGGTFQVRGPAFDRPGSGRHRADGAGRGRHGRGRGGRGSRGA
jgi:hypothetical protein